MEWHLRKIDDELGKRVKVAALERGVSVQAFVVDAVEVALAASVGTGPAASEGQKAVTAAARAEARIVEQVQPVIDSRYAPRPAHDPKTCRVYKCTLCGR